mgnify:CR=1 FL=1
MGESGDLVRRWIEGGWNGKDKSLIDELFHPNYTAEGGASAYYGDIKNLDDLKNYFDIVMQCCPQLNLEIVNIIDAGTFVSLEYIASGPIVMDMGPLKENPNPEPIRCADVYEIEDGKIKRRLLAFSELNKWM